MINAKKRLNADYTVMQIAYWALSAIIFCFTAVFLQFKGYTNYEIGIVFALGNVAGFFLQPMIAGYVDKTHRKTLLKCMRITAALSVILMAAVYFMPENCLPLTAAYVLLLGGIALLQPLCTSLCFYLESWGYSINFSRARAIGSLSYSLCTMVLGILVQRVSENAVAVSYIVFCILLGGMTFVFSSKEKSHGICAEEVSAPSEKASSLAEFAKENRKFMFFLFGIALLYFPHALIGNFMIEFIRSIGGDSGDLGNVLAFMTLTEVPVMLLFARLTKKFRVSSLLRLSVVMFTVKEFMIFLAQSIPALYAAEALQALSFAILIPASVRYVDEIISAKNAVKGQAFVTAMLTLGSIFASYFGGLLLDTRGTQFTLLTGVIISAVGTLVLLFSIQTTKAP